MSKLLNSTLEKVSENNNDYRKNLRALNNQIDERTTALVGDIVTLSNYTTDFSNTMNVSKDKLVNPILRVIESYAIRDLRNVETVNEQFIEKINDKIENTTISNKQDKEKFISNLDVLLNEKYLEIVNIKRVNFIGENGNQDIENIIGDFVSYLVNSSSYDESRLLSLINGYKNDIYGLISKVLADINKLYLDNFVNEVSSDLKNVVDFEDPYDNEKLDEFKPYIPDINPVEKIDLPMIPNIPEFDKSSNEFKPVDNDVVNDISIPPFNFNVPTFENVTQNSITNPKENEEENTSKKKYDVEEILKIAKSPVAAVEEKDSEQKEKIIPFSKAKEQESIEMEYNERDLVEEMIRRFTKRLEAIDERQSKYEENKKHIDDDEAFVKDLINSASIKQDELDSFEEELDKKADELDEKERELDEKINNVLPFANAVLENDKES